MSFITRNILSTNICRAFYNTKRFQSDKVLENVPVKFSTSGAAKRRVVTPVQYNAQYEDMPWFQPFIISGSILAFLVYFCLLREESDVDLEFNRTLYERIEGLEKQQLLQSYQYNKEHGLSVLEIEEKLNLLSQEENVKTN